MTRNALPESCDLPVLALDLYTPATIRTIQETLHSDQGVTTIMRLVHKRPTEELLLKIIG